MEVLLILVGVSIISVGAIYFRRRRAEEQRKLERDLRYSTTYFDQAVQHAIDGDHDRAIETYEKSLQFNPEQVVVPEPNLAIAYYNKGHVAADAGKLDEAMYLFGCAHALDPDPAATYQFKGLSHALAADYDAAINEYDKAVLINPDNPYLYYNRGQTHAARQDYDGMIEDYTEFIRLQPSNAGAYRNRGRAFVHKEDYDRAIVDYTKAIELAPDEMNAHVERGLAFLARGKSSTYGQTIGYFTKAIEDFSRVIALGSDDASPHTNRGLAYVAIGKYEEAIEDFNRAAELEPNNASIYVNMATASFREGDGQYAIDCLDDAIILDPDNAAVYFMRAAIDYQFDVLEDDFFEAIDKAIVLASGHIDSHCLSRSNSALSVDPKLCCLAHAHELRADALYHGYHGPSWFENSDEIYAKALEDIDKIIALTPEEFPELMSSAYMKRGRILVEAGELDSGLNDLDKAVCMDSSNADAYQNRAIAHARKGDYKRAIYDVTKAIEVSRDRTNLEQLRLKIITNRAHTSLATGEYDDALADYNEVIKELHHSAADHFLRGTAYKLSGNYERARTDFDRALFISVSGSNNLLDPIWITEGEDNEMGCIRSLGRFNPDNPWDWCHVGIAHLIRDVRRDDVEDAIEAFSRAIEYQPDYADAYRNRGYAYYHWVYDWGGYHDDLKACLSDFAEAICLNPNDPLTYFFRGDAYSRMFEDYDKAIADFTMAISLGLNEATSYCSRGLAYEAKCIYENAIVDYGEAIRLDPNDSYLYELRAEAFEKIGENTKATEDRKRVMEMRQSKQTVRLVKN